MSERDLVLELPSFDGREEMADDAVDRARRIVADL
jgi:hypothetical protein